MSVSLLFTSSIAYCDSLIRVENGTMNYAKALSAGGAALLPNAVQMERSTFNHCSHNTWKILRNKHSEVEVNGLHQ